MTKRVFIIHGWTGKPEGDWFPWLKRELESKKFLVYVPEMPNTYNPTIKFWVSHLKKVVGEVNEDTYLIGHSIGCQTIMRYLENLSENEKVGGAIFVAGWFNLTDETWDETFTKKIADEWIHTPINFDQIKKHTNSFILINSNNDPYIPLSDVELFRENLGAKIIWEKNKGHISGEDGVKELPIVLDELLKMARV